MEDVGNTQQITDMEGAVLTFRELPASCEKCFLEQR